MLWAYKRQLILHSNAYPANHTLTVKVQTAALPIEKRKIPSDGLIGLFLMTVVVAMATTWFITYSASAVASWLLQIFGYGWILFIGILSLMYGSWVVYYTLKQGVGVGVAVYVGLAMMGEDRVWVIIINLPEDSFTTVLIQHFRLL